jgi:dephospho-CoA kinase
LKPGYPPHKITVVKIIGLTGNIASGKSSVADMFEKLGAKTIDADRVARSVVEPHKPAWKEIVEKFGSEVLNPDGTIDREKLGEIVFNNEDKRSLLNDITHPRILEEIKEFIESSRNEENSIVIIEAALIVEKGGWLRDIVESLIVVSANEESRIERLMERNGYTRDEALSRINSQMPSAEKEKHGDFIIDNSGSTEATESQVISVWDKIKESK